MTPAERARGPGLREALVAALRESVLRRGDDQMASWRGVAGDGLTPDEALAGALMVSLRAALAARGLTVVRKGEVDVERLAEAMHDSYLRDPAVPRIEYDDLGDAERVMWRNHARNVAAEYARLARQPEGQ